MFKRAHASFPAIAPHVQGLVGPVQQVAFFLMGLILQSLDRLLQTSLRSSRRLLLCMSRHRSRITDATWPSGLHEEFGDGRPVVRIRIASGPLISCKCGSEAGSLPTVLGIQGNLSNMLVGASMRKGLRLMSCQF